VKVIGNFRESEHTFYFFAAMRTHRTITPENMHQISAAAENLRMLLRNISRFTGLEYELFVTQESSKVQYPTAELLANQSGLQVQEWNIAFRHLGNNQLALEALDELGPRKIIVLVCSEAMVEVLIQQADGHVQYDDQGSVLFATLTISSLIVQAKLFGASDLFRYFYGHPMH